VPVVITGSSDDLIEVDGDLSEEFYSPDGGRDEGDLLACSDGTMLRISYTREGIWRITPVEQGSATLTIEQAPENDEDRYTDTATLDGPISWVVLGTQIAK
jgi:predicted methyltransferase